MPAASSAAAVCSRSCVGNLAVATHSGRAWGLPRAAVPQLGCAFLALAAPSSVLAARKAPPLPPAETPLSLPLPPSLSLHQLAMPRASETHSQMTSPNPLLRLTTRRKEHAKRRKPPTPISPLLRSRRAKAVRKNQAQRSLCNLLQCRPLCSLRRRASNLPPITPTRRCDKLKRRRLSEPTEE
jgi:hypothetical protein